VAISKSKKVEILAHLDEGLKTAESVAFVNFHGLSVTEVTALRKALRAEGVSYYVAKKTLVKRALDAKGVAGEQPELVGELALAWSMDPIAAAKGVHEFAKTHKEHMSLVGGVYQGAYMSKEAITSLASIPSREVMLGQFVGMLNNSIANVVRAFDAKAKQMEAVSVA
jgi:large subunit ribosomal protein L10